VADNGCGLPAAFGHSKTKSLGIIRSLASQLRGEVTFKKANPDRDDRAFAFPA
jgi:two-component sensor histidine kinase